MNNLILLNKQDFLDKKIKELFEFVTTTFFPWFLEKNKKLNLQKIFINEVEYDYEYSIFSHTCYIDEQINSDYFVSCIDIFKDFLNYNNLKDIKKLIRVKLNLFHSSENKNDIFLSDINFDNDHKIFICFIDDFEEKIIFYDSFEKLKYKEINHIVSGQGKAVIIKGSTPYGILLPKNNKFRVVLVIDYI